MARTKGAKDKKPRVLSQADSLARAKRMSPEIDGKFCSQTIKFMMEFIPTDPLDHNDVAEMERRFLKYLEVCDKYEAKVSNLAAYAAIGITKDTADDWSMNRKANPERFHFIKKVQQICSVFREKAISESKLNPVIGIFWQKNFDGLRDQQEVVVTPNTPLGDDADPDALRKRYIDSTYGIEGNKPAISDKNEDE